MDKTKTVSDDSDEVRFREWWILRDNVRRFPDVLRANNRVIRGSAISVFGVGSPRCCSIIVTLTNHGKSIRKTFRVDIRDASCEFWIDQFDRANWQVIEF